MQSQRDLLHDPPVPENSNPATALGDNDPHGFCHAGDGGNRIVPRPHPRRQGDIAGINGNIAPHRFHKTVPGDDERAVQRCERLDILLQPGVRDDA